MKINEFIDQLKEILNENQILTDSEDLYVYSFEKLFLDQSYPKLDIVVRISTLKEEKQIINLAKKHNIKTIIRGKDEVSHLDKLSNIVLLIDNTKIPTLEGCGENRILKNLYDIHEGDHGTYRNLALVIQNILFNKTLNKCQECITCSGYCTVSPAFNGVETWSSKGKMLIARGIMNRELDLSEKVINTLFACTKCGLCFAQCFKDLEFHEVILYLRKKIADNNLTPPVFLTAANNIHEHGDPSGISINRRLLRIKNMSNLSLPKIAKNLCWLGCTTVTRTPKTAESLINILTRFNVDFTTLGRDEGCCGYILLSTGLWEQAKQVAKEVLQKVEKTQAKVLITPCSGCYYTFKRLYPEILNINLPCEILHTSQFLNEMIKNKEIKLKPLDITVTYHDPCSLGRHSKVYEAPRNVLKAIPHLKLVEMPLNRSCARCCGGGGGLWTFDNETSLQTTQTRLKEDYIQTNANILTTACPQCQLNFRFASHTIKMPNNSLKVYDIIDLFNLAIEP